MENNGYKFVKSYKHIDLYVNEFGIRECFKKGETPRRIQHGNLGQPRESYRPTREQLLFNTWVVL